MDAVPFLFSGIFHLSSLNIVDVDVYACLVHLHWSGLCSQRFARQGFGREGGLGTALDHAARWSQLRTSCGWILLNSHSPGLRGETRVNFLMQISISDASLKCWTNMNQLKLFETELLVLQPSRGFCSATAEETVNSFCQHAKFCYFGGGESQRLVIDRFINYYLLLSLLLSIYHFSISGLFIASAPLCDLLGLESDFGWLWVLFSSFLIFSHRQGRHPCGVGVPVSLGQVLSASGGLDQLIMQNWSVDNSQRPNKRPVSWHCTEFDEGIGRLVFYMLSSWF